MNTIKLILLAIIAAGVWTAALRIPAFPRTHAPQGYASLPVVAIAQPEDGTTDGKLIRAPLP